LLIIAALSCAAQQICDAIGAIFPLPIAFALLA
jgi:hypothetical protein